MCDNNAIIISAADAKSKKKERPCAYKNISRLDKVELFSRSECARTWLWLRFFRCKDTFLDDDILDLDCRSAYSATEIEYKLQTRDVETLLAFHLIYIVFTSLEDMLCIKVCITVGTP